MSYTTKKFNVGDKVVRLSNGEGHRQATVNNPNGAGFWGETGCTYVVTLVEDGSLDGYLESDPSYKIGGADSNEFKLVASASTYVPTEVVVDPYTKWKASYYYALNNTSMSLDFHAQNLVRGWVITNALLALAPSVVWRTNPSHETVTLTVSRTGIKKHLDGYTSVELEIALEKALDND